MSLLTRLRLRRGPGSPAPDSPPGTAGRSWWAHPVISRVGTGLAALLVLGALSLPDRMSQLSPLALVRVPVEALVVAALVLVLPARAARVLATVVGALLGLLSIVALLDLGFDSALSRPFDPVSDWSLFGPAVDFLGSSLGRAGSVLAQIGVGLALLAVPVVMTLAVRRLTGVLTRHRTGTTRGLIVLVPVWAACAALGLQVLPGLPVAGRGATALAYQHVRDARTELLDRGVFGQEIAADRWRDTPGSQLLTGLRGKNVVIAFVESYGRVAIEDPHLAPGVDAILDTGTRDLRAAGFGARSAFLTSPTAGGGSWLAHSTLQSGTWVNSQQRYHQLMAADRSTLTSAFRRVGWRTVADAPANAETWPDGRFYGFDQTYDSRNVGYRGPAFSYATMPDQYTLSALHRQELSNPGGQPVMAEVDLVSSHAPWAPLPHLVDWGAVGDGSVFAPMPAQGSTPEAVWRDNTSIRAAYGQSIEYSVSSLVSYVEKYGDDRLVLILLGDHQPAPVVTGPDAPHDVPITIIAHDQAVLDRISGWGWDDGLRPAPTAVNWRMDTFRDRFLTGFGPTGFGPIGSAPTPSTR